MHAASARGQCHYRQVSGVPSITNILGKLDHTRQAYFAEFTEATNQNPAQVFARAGYYSASNNGTRRRN